MDNTTKRSDHSEAAADLIQPFHRGDATRMANRPGHGLGLSIAKACADAIGARLNISRPTPDMFRAEIVLSWDKREPPVHHGSVEDRPERPIGGFHDE
ncbi:hypothetical protein [Bifidobacterium vansinderenii]|uniref:hypothetical protein n=1 Tax=Bifidobacterium vansinderenii TaxID=1984871 RepID=UPI002FCE1B60